MNIKKFLFISIILGLFTISAVVASSDIKIISEGTQWDKFYSEFHDVDINQVDNITHFDTKVKANGTIQTEASGVSVIIKNGTTYKKIELDKWPANIKDGEEVTVYGYIVGNKLSVEAIKYNY